MTKDEAIDKLMHYPREDLYQLVYDAYKDQYNVRPRHMSNYTVPELVSWYTSHYAWDEDMQCWETIIPFNDEVVYSAYSN